MAKRIKIKGKAPRGLSKSARQTIVRVRESDRAAAKKGHTVFAFTDAEIANLPGIGRGATKPSSTRRKLVKEGSRKFIGPRRLKSELREDADTRWRELNSEFHPAASMSKEDLQIEAASADAARKNMNKGGPRLRGQKRYKKLRPRDEIFGAARDPDFGIGGISKNQRLKALLSKLMAEYDGF